MAREPQSNGLGIAGFVCSLIGVLGCCGIQPIMVIGLVGLILSLIAVRKEPRGFAIAGIVLGVLSMGFVLLVLVFVGGTVLFAAGVLAAIGFEDVAAHIEMGRIDVAIVNYERKNGALPSDLGVLNLGSDLLTDPWGTAYSYRVNDDGTFTMSSNGADTLPDTPDDVKHENVDVK